MSFSPATLKWLQDRAAAFQKATQKKGMPMIYGAQKREKRK